MHEPSRVADERLGIDEVDKRREHFFHSALDHDLGHEFIDSLRLWLLGKTSVYLDVIAGTKPSGTSYIDWQVEFALSSLPKLQVKHKQGTHTADQEQTVEPFVEKHKLQLSTDCFSYDRPASKSQPSKQLDSVARNL